mmetsp:Transcript_93005/g.240320  ORF Transcript_93005/g.240320 Transcript_93005/m.240320 type:complete len:510 (-) Transcript_93005:198-1727(-)
MAPTPGSLAASFLAALALWRAPWPLDPTPPPLLSPAAAGECNTSTASGPPAVEPLGLELPLHDSASAAEEPTVQVSVEGAGDEVQEVGSGTSSAAASRPSARDLAPAAIVVLAEVLVVVSGFAFMRFLRTRRRRRRLREEVKQFEEAVHANVGPLESFSGPSIRELSALWGWRSPGALPRVVVLQVAAFLLEPSEVGSHVEDLDRMPRSLHHFRLAKCTLGTTLAFEPLALRLGNVQVWRGATSDAVSQAAVNGGDTSAQHLILALPQGALPWGLPSHRGVVAVWHGDPNPYTPQIPVGPPVLKLPIAALTAMDCHNRELRLEFSFDAPPEAKMRPRELRHHRGTLLALSFEESPEGAGEVASFIGMLAAKAGELAGHQAEVVLGLPNRGMFLPSKVYCRRTRQAAELAWALLNIAFLVQPLLKIWKLGPFALGIDGFLKLCMSSPQTAVQPVVNIAQKVGEVRKARMGNLGRPRVWAAALASRWRAGPWPARGQRCAGGPQAAGRHKE